MTQTELILIRHGQSHANAGLSKDPDCLLTEAGIAQARKVGERVAQFDLREFSGLVSPYCRARATAQEIERVTGLNFTVEEGIREWGSRATVNEKIYETETAQELIERLRLFLDRHAGRKLVIVSHASPIAVLTQLAWGNEPDTTDDFAWRGVPNCCLHWARMTR